MAADGNHDNNQPDVQKAIQAGTDVSHGSDQAYNNLMAEVNNAAQRFGNDTAGFNKYGQAVADGLRQNGAMEEMAEQFAKSDLYHLAHSDGRHLKEADLNPAFGTDSLKSAFLASLRDAYATGDLQRRAGTTWLGNTRDEFGGKELDHVLSSRQHDRDVVEQTRLSQEAATREQTKFANTTGALFANDGNPQHSLYSVLDGIKTGDGHTDGKISRGDLRRYQQDYAVRAARGDFGFTPDNLETVRTLDREWDKPMGVALRGTYERQNGRGPDDRVTNSTINLEAASQAMHTTPEGLYAANGPANGGRTMSNVNADSAPVEGERKIPGADTTQQQFDAAGNPIQDGGTAAAPATTRGIQPRDTTAPAPIQRPVGNDGRPVAAGTDASQRPAATAAPRDGSAYDDYDLGRDQQPATTTAATGDRTAPPAQRQPAGDANATAPSRPAEARVAKPRADAVPDIEHMPPLELPTLKAGDDPKKVAEDFQKAAIAHFAAAAVYTVKPGQGWDRIARDTMRKSSEDTSNEGKTEQYSDAIAKANGLSGRLDKSRVLQPGDQVRVRDDDWVKAQVETAMAALQKQMTDAAKPAGDGTAAATTTTPDLYPDSRNGGGVVDQTATKPAGSDATTTTVPATGDASKQTVAPTGDAAKQPPPVTDATTAQPAPGAVDTTSAPPAIPKGAPPAEMPTGKGAAINPDATQTQAAIDAAAAAEAKRKAAVASSDADANKDLGNPLLG